MQGGDGGLRLVLAEPLAGQGDLQDVDALGDHRGVPSGAVLLVQRNQLARGGVAGVPAGMVEQHQGEQAGDLGVCRADRVRGGRGDKLAGQADRLGGERDLAGEPLVEDQVQHVEHGPDVAGRVEPFAADRALGAGDPLRHRRLGDQERARDLRGGEPADSAQRQRDRRRRAQRRMAAAAQQEQRVVRLLGRPLCGFVVDPFLSPPSGSLGTLGVDQLAAGDPQEPRLRVVGRIVGPVADRLDEGLLHGVLGRREVCSATDEDAQDLRRQRPHQVVHPVFVHAAVLTYSAVACSSAKNGRTSSHS